MLPALEETQIYACSHGVPCFNFLKKAKNWRVDALDIMQPGVVPPSPHYAAWCGAFSPHYATWYDAFPAIMQPGVVPFPLLCSLVWCLFPHYARPSPPPPSIPVSPDGRSSHASIHVLDPVVQGDWPVSRRDINICWLLVPRTSWTEACTSWWCLTNLSRVLPVGFFACASQTKRWVLPGSFTRGPTTTTP